MPAILPHIILETAPNPQHSIIWLHGLGADGEDFVPVAEEMRLPVPVRYLFPHAPKQAVTLNGGFIMRSWYDIVSADISASQDAAGIYVSQQEIEKLIAHEYARGILPAHLFLAGFSQGGAIALHCGLRHAAPLGGILALSTYLPLANTLKDDVPQTHVAPPIFMAHGRNDPIIPYSLAKQSYEILSQQHYPVEWHEYPMPHSVCPQELRDIEAWLSRHLHHS